MTTLIVTGGRPVVVLSTVRRYGSAGAYAPVPRSLLWCWVSVDDGGKPRRVVEHGAGGARVPVDTELIGQQITVTRTPGVPRAPNLNTVRDGLVFLLNMDPDGVFLNRLMALLEDDAPLVDELAERIKAAMGD